MRDQQLIDLINFLDSDNGKFFGPEVALPGEEYVRKLDLTLHLISGDDVVPKTIDVDLATVSRLSALLETQSQKFVNQQDGGDIDPFSYFVMAWQSVFGYIPMSEAQLMTIAKVVIHLNENSISVNVESMQEGYGVTSFSNPASIVERIKFLNLMSNINGMEAIRGSWFCSYELVMDRLNDTIYGRRLATPAPDAE